MITHPLCVAQISPCDDELFVCIVSHRQCVHLQFMCRAHFAFSTAIKFRPSHLAVDLAHRLVKELQLKPDRYTQLSLDKAEQSQKDRLASSRFIDCYFVGHRSECLRDGFVDSTTR